MNIKFLLTSGLLVATLASNAQSNRAFAITGDGNKDFMWMNIREIDLGSGQITKTIFQRSTSKYFMTDVASKKTIDQTATANVFGSRDYPTGTLVAAAAFDRRTNKLFFTPMRIGELRWLDMDNRNEPAKFYSISSPVLQTAIDPRDEASNLTRMVIAADGNGYAVSNDGNHLIRFTTGKIPQITDLGNLVDAESTNGISVHNKCGSWGGDMIADAYGKLYIISAMHQIFEVNIDTRIATHKGTITGLPNGFTTNAAAVNDKGEIVITSANSFDGYYTFTMDNLTARKLAGSDTKYNASDFAGSNLLFQKEADAAVKFTRNESKLAPIVFGSNSKIFPNPITESTFRVQFDGKKEGVYIINLTDLAGRVLQTNKVTINKAKQVVNINLDRKPIQGIYMINVLDASKNNVITEKVIIE